MLSIRGFADADFSQVGLAKRDPPDALPPNWNEEQLQLWGAIIQIKVMAFLLLLYL